MANKMLIDASHPEETRVVVTRGHKVEEFDFESANRRQLRGNIYLAKVTRVEPSLQAAFVEYGGNRHGFLAFSEIHPDYYQIPVADRLALIEAESRAEQEEEKDEERRGRGRRRRGSSRRNRGNDETVTAPVEANEQDPEGDEHQNDEAAAEAGESEHAPGEAHSRDDQDHAPASNGSDHQDVSVAESAGVESAETQASPEQAQSDEAAPAAQLAPAPEAPTAVADAWAPIVPEPEKAAEAPAEEPAQAEPTASAEPADVAAVSDSRLTDEAAPTEAGSRDEASESSEQPAATAQERDSESDEEDDEEDEDDEDELEEHEIVEQVGGDDALEEVSQRQHRSHRRHYKIQEVIKRRQILLVQVVKEERGNKGAALTTYLSLAGRYSVLMPNTGKGGGISRKITSAEDRKRLKEVVQDLEVPEGMGVILRTAGANRTKPEIKRDFEYLMRLWESVRELTLSSAAPALVYEEGSLIKRAIRDLYNKDIDDVLVSGEEGYQEAKDFMRMIMPGQSRIVKPHREPQPLFAQYGIEAQLDAMFSSHVTLKSGGYLVINPTEALVSIDVNSGRSTREHNIEDTALRTNLEASEEIARQLRLRDLAGLIVIDFIDMEEKRNDRAVEKKLKDCLKNDRARIQVGRISPFGLLEMSRQRIRTGVLESSSVPCRHCAGTGFMRATPSVALQILRSAEETLLRSASHNLIVRTRTEVAFYILNQKRAHLSELEERFGVAIEIVPDDSLSGTTTVAIDRGEPAVPVERKAPVTGVRIDTVMPVDEPIEVDPTVEFEREMEDEAEGEEAAAERAPRDAEGGEENGRRRRRRRRRRGGRNGEAREASEGGSATDEAGEEFEDEDERAEAPEGRPANDDERGQPQSDLDPSEAQPAVIAEMAEALERIRPASAEAEGSLANGADHAPEATAPADALPEAASASSLDPVPETPAAEPPTAEATPETVPAAAPEPEPEPVAIVLTPPADPSLPKRAGWWSKAKAALGGS
jgi:ribonuclease E